MLYQLADVRSDGAPPTHHQPDQPTRRRGVVCVGMVGAWNFITGASLYCQLQLYKQVYTNVHRNLTCKLCTQ